MNSTEQTIKIRKAKTAFWLNLSICLIAMIVGFRAIDNEILWKIIASSIGFVGFFILTLISFQRLKRLVKQFD